MRISSKFLIQSYALAILLTLVTSHLYAQNQNEDRVVFMPDLRQLFENESVSSVVDEWERNGIVVTDNTPNDLFTTLSAIYAKYKHRSDSIIVITGMGEAENLKTAMLLAESSAIVSIGSFIESKMTMMSSLFISESTTDICLDNLTSLEVLQKAENAKIVVWKFYVYLMEDVNCSSACLNCCQVHSIAHSEGQRHFTQNNFILFPNDDRSIHKMLRSVYVGNQEMVVTELLELTQEGGFWFRQQNEVEEIIESNE